MGAVASGSAVFMVLAASLSTLYSVVSALQFLRGLRRCRISRRLGCCCGGGVFGWEGVWTGCMGPVAIAARIAADKVGALSELGAEH